MSYQDFMMALTLYAKDLSFEALIMAAMLQVEEGDRKERLIQTFPDIWNELQARTQAPGGKLPEDAVQ